MRTFDEITRIVKDLQMHQGPVLNRMKDILDRYDGDWILPMPDIDKEPNLPKPDGVKKVQIVEGGPSSEESADLCEDGICLLPSTEQSSGANVALPADAPKESKSEPKSSIEKTIEN